MSANFRNPNFLLPNELNRRLPASGAETGSGLTEDRHSLYSMEFDGGTSANKIVATGEKFNFVQQTGIFSVSCWIKLDNYTSATLQSICHTDNGGRLQDGFWLFYDNRSTTGSAKRLGFYLYGGNSYAHNLDLVAKENAFSDNDWHHVAVVGSSAGTYGTLTLYIDGSSVATRALISGSLTTDTAYNDFTIGDYDSNNAFDGKIDEVAIWSSDQTSNISNIYNGGSPGNIMALSNKPYAYYPLGEQARDNTNWQFPNEVLQSQVFDFDGTDDNVTLSNELSGAGTSSASFWIKRNSSSPADDGGILGLVGSGDTSDYISIALWQGVIQSSVANTTNHKGSTTIAVDTWYHVMVVKNSSATTAIYVNGVAETLSTGGTWLATIDTPQAKIGGVSYVGTSYNFQGEISNVAIWNSDQSANITNIYNYGTPQSSYTVTPTAWYKLNATNTYAGLNPNYHNALSFDGSDQIDFGNDSSFNFTGGMTVSGWVKGSAGSGTKKIILKDDLSSQRSWQMNIRSSSSNLPTANVRGGSDVPTVTGTKTLLDDNWHHFALVFTPSTSLSFFIDGEPAGTQTSGVPASIDTSTANVIIGFNQFAGEASNFAIFNQSISAEDVKYLYNGGTPQTNISFEPVSWWKLDNLTTGIQDSGSASNNGTNSGATAVSSSVAVNQWNFNNVSQSQTPNYSTALDFDGNNDYINSSYTLPASTTTFSASMWVNTASLSTLQGLIGSQDSSSDGYWVSISSNNINFKLNGAISAASTSSLSANTWFHLVVTYDGSTAKTYINNNAPVSNSITETIDVTADTIIGRLPWAGFYFLNGSISNAAIYNTTLSASDVETLFNIGNPQSTILGSPQAWWKLDSTTITDYSGNGNTGTNNGATEIQTNVWTPRLNGESTTLPTSALTSSDLQFESPYSNFSLNFDGTGDYIDCGSPSLFDDLTSFSFSCWFNSNVKSNDDGILGKWLSSTNRSFALNLETSGNIRFAVFNSGGTAAQSYINTSDWSTGNWYNVIGTYDGSNVKLYLDGVLKDTVALTGTVRNSTQSFRIGRYGSSSDFQGKIDETAIWNSALTQAQVSQVYNNGFAADLTSLSPISWWRLGEDAYFVGNDITIPNQISGAPNGTGAGTMTSILVANAPGSYASGVGTDLDVVDRKGEAPESSANSQSINMIPGDVHPYIPGYVPAQVNNVASMSFDGINDYFDAGSSLGVIGSNAYTFSAWLKTSYTGGIQTILSTRDQSADNGWVLQINSTSIQFFNEKNNTNIYTENNPTLTDGVWHNIVIVRGGSTATNAIYQDGSPITLTINTENGTSPQSASNLSIGSTITSASSPRFFDGNIDELAIFNYALTPKQIKEDIYNASTTGKTADLNNNSNLTAPVAWYRMGD